MAEKPTKHVRIPNPHEVEDLVELAGKRDPLIAQLIPLARRPATGVRALH